MKRKMMSLALALVMSLSLCVPALAAESAERIEHLSTNSIITYIPSISPRANDPTHYTYIFTNVRCTTQHIEKVVAGPASNANYPSEGTWPHLTYSKGVSTTFSGSISAQITIPSNVIQANVSVNAGKSASVTNTESIDYAIPYRYKASIVCYVNRQYYTFHCVVQNLAGITISEFEGNCTGGVYNSGYDVSLVRI